MRCWCSFLAGAGLLSLATPLPAETLADAIALAYQSNPTIESSRYDVRAADEDIVQAKSELRPTATLSANGGFNRFYPGSSVSPADPSRSQLFDTNNGQVQLSVTQPLLTGGRASADRASAEAGVRAGRETLRGAEGDVLLGVITAYVDVRRSEQTLTVWQASVSDLERIGKEIVARQEAGELTRTDIAQADAQTALARQQLALTEQDLEAARADYVALVGRNPGTLAEEPPLPQLPRDVDTAFELAIRESPDIAKALYTEQGSRAQVDAARSQAQPTLGLRGSGALSGDSEPWRLQREDRGYSASVVLSLPLSQGGRVASQIRQAQERNGADRLRIEEQRRAVLRAVTNAWNQMATAERTAVLQDEQRRAATIQLDGMINEYRVGLRSTFDVLYAEQSLRDAEVAALRSGRDRYVAQATLLRRTGRLEAQALLTNIALYDASAHLRHVEHKNALPWDGLVAALDRTAAPHLHQRAILQPATLPGRSAMVAGIRRPPDPHAPLAHETPTTPILGTAGRPALPSDRKDRS